MRNRSGAGAGSSHPFGAMGEGVKALYDAAQEVLIRPGAWFCGEIAVVTGSWSDRGPMPVCDEHRPEVQKAHDGDHSYDQTGVYWSEPLTANIALGAALAEVAIGR